MGIVEAEGHALIFAVFSPRSSFTSPYYKTFGENRTNVIKLKPLAGRRLADAEDDEVRCH
jgi:hypothetical protein